MTFERLGGTRAIYQCIGDELLLSVNGENYPLPLSDLDVKANVVLKMEDMARSDNVVFSATGITKEPKRRIASLNGITGN